MILKRVRGGAVQSLVLTTGLWALAAPAEEVVDRVAAVVNTEVIALSEVEQRGGQELARAGGGKGRSDMLTKLLDQMIGEKLLEKEIRDLGIEVTEAEVDTSIEDVRKQYNMDGEALEKALRNDGYTMTTYRQFMRRYLEKAKLVNLKVRSKVKLTDEELRAEYNRWANMESADPEVHARHIVVQIPKGAAAPAGQAVQAMIEEARKRAVSLAVEARKPGVDFSELAKKKSEGPSAAEGGDLGFFKRGTMLPEFDKAAFSLKDGEVSDPVRSQWGWHVIKVEERRASPPKPFEEVKDQLRERLLRSQLDRYTDQYVRELREKALVEVKI